MNKKYLLVFVFFGLLAASLTYAQTESVTTQDLGVSEPRVLPGSPFYFFKSWGRGVRSAFTFNPVKKAELELRYADEKVSEVKKLAETSPDRVSALERAVENYRLSQEKLKARLEALRETSQNPNVDKLLEKVADRTVKHEKLFDELKEKFENKKELGEKLKEAEEHIAESAASAAEKDDPAKFASRLEKAFTESRGGNLKHLQSVDILDRISDKAPDKVKKVLENLRQDFTDRLQEDFEEFIKKVDEKTFQDTVRDLPGDVAHRAVIIEEIKRKAGKTAAEALEKVGKVLDDSLKERGEGGEVRAFPKEKALEQVDKAEEKISELNKKIAGAKEVPDSVKKSLSEAEVHLKNAKAAYESGKFDEAFGQARSAEVLARNGLRMLENADEDTDNLKEALRELEAKIGKYALWLEERKMTRESNSKAFELLDNAKQHLGFAYDALSKGDIAAVKMHMGHVRGFLAELARIIEAVIREVALPTQPPKPVHSPRPVPQDLPVSDDLPAVIHASFATVEVDDNGFSPREVKIKKGGEIKWFNKSSRKVWPASAVHPTHQAYPGFDALRGLSTGESYSFIFEKAGSWSYHDHFNPGVVGVVVVVE